MVVPRAKDQSAGWRPHFAVPPKVRAIAKVAIPLLLGLVTAVYLIASAGKGYYIDITKSRLMTGPAFSGLAIVYAIFASSLIVAVSATFMYIFDLDDKYEYFYGRSGRAGIRQARRLTIYAVIGCLVGLIAYLVPSASHTAVDCTFDHLDVEFFAHVGVVGVLFAVFIAIDQRTLASADAALEDANLLTIDSGDPRHPKLILAFRDFSKQQLWLIDIPVLVASFFSILIVAGARKLNPELLHFANVSGEITCGGQPLNFEASVVNVFISGVSTGFIAAHVILSQLVFLALNVIYLRAEEEIREQNPVKEVRPDALETSDLDS